MRMLEFVLVGSMVLLTGCTAASFWPHSSQKQHRHRLLQSVSRHQTVPLTSSLHPPSVPIAETVMTYCQALTGDNISTAFALLDPDTQHVVKEADFDAQLDRAVLRHHGLRTCKLLDPIAVFQGEKAKTIITLSYGNGSQDKLALALLEEDQHWKILFVSFLCTFPPGTRDPHAAPCCIASPQVLFPQSCSK